MLMLVLLLGPPSWRGTDAQLWILALSLSVLAASNLVIFGAAMTLACLWEP